MDSSATTPTEAPRRGRVLKWLLVALLAVSTAGGAAAATWFYGPPSLKEAISNRYATADEMAVPLTEFSAFEYPEDPSPRSSKHGHYQGRKLTLRKRDDAHFDFIFTPADGHDHVATISFENVDVSRMTPGVPEWCRDDAGLTRIALTDREWNRQQVQFPVAVGEGRGENVLVDGGDGWEKENLAVASLAKNCLNAGLWEVLLFHFDEEGKKQMYYQGWFTFPLGHYRDLVEANTGQRYEDHWFGLEHWDDPAGTVLDLDVLRTVASEREVDVSFDPEERLIVGGEQVRKKRTLLAPDLTHWGQFPERPDVRFATFIPPGRYSVSHPWENEYERLRTFDRGVLRATTNANGSAGHELELQFSDDEGRANRFIVGGIDIDALPTLPVSKYPNGLYMPMGIGTPPFYQDYAALLTDDPMRSPYYSFLLDSKNRWIDHHAAAVDGPVMHRDVDDPNNVHLYLLSYERHTLVGHFVIDISEPSEVPATKTNATPREASNRRVSSH